MAAYIDRGDVQFTYKYMLNDPANSPAAAEATECAAEQGKFWAYKGTVYDHFNNRPYPRASLKQWAKNLNLDTETFNACFDSGKYRKQVQNQSAEGTKAGVTGTPTFFINGKMVVGFDPQKIFATIDAELKK